MAMYDPIQRATIALSRLLEQQLGIVMITRPDDAPSTASYPYGLLTLQSRGDGRALSTVLYTYELEIVAPAGQAGTKAQVNIVEYALRAGEMLMLRDQPYFTDLFTRLLELSPTRAVLQIECEMEEPTA